MTLAQVADEIKVRPSLLEKIEHEQADQHCAQGGVDAGTCPDHGPGERAQSKLEADAEQQQQHADVCDQLDPLGLLDASIAHGSYASCNGPKVTAYTPVCMTGTTANVIPVVSVDDQAIADGSAGPVTRALRDRFHGVTHGEDPDFEHWLTYVDEG